MRERLGSAVARGFRAVKLEEWPGGFAHGSVAQDVQVVQLAREVLGPERDLMIDVQNRWQEVGRALSTLRAIEPFGVFFVEAPFPADNLAASYDPPAIYGSVEFDIGGRFMFDFTDCDLDSLSVGKSVFFSFRKKYHDEKRDISGYFWKAVPVKEVV